MSFRGGCFYKHRLHKYLLDGEVCLHKSQCTGQTTRQTATEIREGKVSYTSFPCTVSSELLPANTSGEHGTQVTVPGGGGWTADRTSPALWWEAQWCCRMDGWMDGKRVEKEYRHWEGKRWASHLLYAVRWFLILAENWGRSLSSFTLIYKKWETRVLSLNSATKLKYQLHKSMTKQSSSTP